MKTKRRINPIAANTIHKRTCPICFEWVYVDIQERGIKEIWRCHKCHGVKEYTVR